MDSSYWKAIPRTDFVAETKLFLLQGKYLDALVPSQTLYTVSFGIKYVNLDTISDTRMNDPHQWRRPVWNRYAGAFV